MVGLQRVLGPDVPLGLAERPQLVGQGPGQDLPEPAGQLGGGTAAELVPGRVRPEQRLLGDVAGVELGREPRPGGRRLGGSRYFRSPLS